MACVASQYSSSPRVSIGRSRCSVGEDPRARVVGQSVLTRRLYRMGAARHRTRVPLLRAVTGAVHWTVLKPAWSSDLFGSDVQIHCVQCRSV